MSKKVLKNKSKILTRGVLPALIVSGGVLSAVGFGSFIHCNKQYYKIQDEINNNVAQITSTEEYINYKNAQEKNYYEMYKSGYISSTQFEKYTEELNSSQYIIKNEVPVNSEEKSNLANLENEKLKQSLGVLAGITSFVCLGGLSCSVASVYLDAKDKTKDKEREMSE